MSYPRSYISCASHQFTSGSQDVKYKVSSAPDKMSIRGIQTAIAKDGVDISTIDYYDGSSGPSLFKIPVAYGGWRVVCTIVPEDSYIRVEDGLYVSASTAADISNLWVTVFYG